jgi:Ca2+/Na+ antiporter
MIYGALIIPLVTIVLLLVYWKGKTTWWEFCLMVAVPAIFIVVMKLMVTISQTSDTEYWGGWDVTAEYYEKWREEYDETYTETVGTGKDARTVVKTRHVVVDHPPEWYAIDSNGVKKSVTRSHYDWLKQKWGVRDKETNLVHMNQTSFGDGDMWTARWTGSEETRVLSTTVHSYENRTQASKVFYWPPVEEEEQEQFALHQYPSVSYTSGGLFSGGTVNYHTTPSILGNGGPTTAKANEQLCLHNALMGKRKQVRMWILIYHDQPESAALHQKNLWENGNKNEFILCIGVDKEFNVEWANVFSWCEQELLKLEVRDFVLDQKKLNLEEVVGYMTTNVDRKFSRREFAEFSYLSVEPPFWGIMLTFFLTLAVDAGLAYWIIHNEHHDLPGFNRFRRRRM